MHTESNVRSQAHKKFGTAPETDTLVRTAALLTFQQRYPSIDAAFANYCKRIPQARKSSGTRPDAESAVKTAAIFVFTTQHSSMSEVYREHIKTYKAVDRL